MISYTVGTPGGNIVTSIVSPGTNTTCTPLVAGKCVGDVTINASGGGGSGAPSNIYINSHFLSSIGSGTVTHWFTPVNVGQTVIIYTQRGSVVAPVSALGNTFSLLSSSGNIQWWISSISIPGNDQFQLPADGFSSHGRLGLLLSGVTGVLDQASYFTGTGTAINIPSVTTTNANDLIIGFAQLDNGNPCTLSRASGYQQIEFMTVDETLSDFFTTVSAIGTYSASVTAGGSGGCVSSAISGSLIALNLQQ